MPKYCYKCHQCGFEFEATRSMSERSDPIACEQCDTLVTKRIPQIQNVKRSSNVGNLVDQAIRENAEILKQQKQKLKESK